MAGQRIRGRTGSAARIYQDRLISSAKEIRGHLLDCRARPAGPRARAAKEKTGFASDRALMNARMILSPNRSYPRVKSEGMLWRIMGWERECGSLPGSSRWRARRRARHARSDRRRGENRTSRFDRHGA